MTRDALLRALRRYCRAKGLAFYFNPGKGKGGHGTVYVGEVFTIVKSGDLSNINVQTVLKQLGLPKDAL